MNLVSKEEFEKLFLLIGNEDTKEFEETNFGPSGSLFALTKMRAKSNSFRLSITR